jgi:hypothetical protein
VAGGLATQALVTTRRLPLKSWEKQMCSRDEKWLLATQVVTQNFDLKHVSSRNASTGSKKRQNGPLFLRNPVNFQI